MTKAVLKLGCNPTNWTNRSILGQFLFKYLSYLGTPALPFADRVIEYQRSSCKKSKSWHFTRIKWWIDKFIIPCCKKNLFYTVLHAISSFFIRMKALWCKAIRLNLSHPFMNLWNSVKQSQSRLIHDDLIVGDFDHLVVWQKK